MRCVFVGCPAFLGRVDGETRCAFWTQEPVDHGFDPGRLIDVDLALTPSAAAAGEIGWDQVLPAIRRAHVGVVAGEHAGRVRSPAGRLLGGAWWSGCRRGVHSVVTSVMAVRAEDSSTMFLVSAKAASRAWRARLLTARG